MLIAVTGSSGRLGTAVVRELMNAGHDVRCIDVKSLSSDNQAAGNLPPTRIADLTNLHQVTEVLDGVEAIVHLANIPGFGEGRPAEGFSNNVNSNFCVFYAAAQLGVRSVVNASSIQAYGSVRNTGEEKLVAPIYLPVDEQHPLLACNPYGLSKAVGENIAAAHARKFPEMSAFSLRFTYIMTSRPPRGPVESALNTCVQRADAAIAVRLAIEQDRPGHTPLNIASAKSVPPWTKEELIRAFGQVPPFKRELRPEEALVCSRAAEKLLGFTASPPPSADFQKP